jgi:hypothetical protein
LLERLTANAKVATALGSIPEFSGTVESEGAADEAVLNNVHKKNPKKPVKLHYHAFRLHIGKSRLF